MSATRTEEHPTRERPAVSAAGGGAILGTYRALAAVAALLILAQAVLAGQWMFAGGRIDVHGWLGNGTFLAVVGLVALAVLGRRGGTLGGADLALSALLLLLVVAQLGLGYAGRERAAAASWHIPNGVLLTGVTAAILALALTPRGAPGTARR